MNYLSPSHIRFLKILLCVILGGGIFSGTLGGCTSSAFALENFTTFRLTQSTISDDRKKFKDEVKITGKFSLSPTGMGINPITESVTVTLKGNGGATPFSQTIPAGSFIQEKKSGKPIPGAFTFKGKGKGSLDTVILKQTPSGNYDFSINGKQLEFACCLPAKVLFLIIGDDGGAINLKTKRQIPIDRELKVTGLIPAQLLIPLSEPKILTVQVENPDQNQNMVVGLASADPTIASVPPEVILPAGSTTGNVTVTGVTEGGPIVITATLNNTSAMSEVTVVMRPSAPVIAEPLAEGSTLVGGTGVPGALLDVQVNGQAAGMGIVEANGQFGVPVPTLAAGAIVQAIQTLNGIASMPSASVTVLPLPPAPVLKAPLVEDMTIIMGTGVPDAKVEIFINTIFASQGIVQMDGTFAVTIPPLVGGQEITAKQTVAGVTSNPSQPITVVQTPAPPVITTPVVAGSSSVAGAGQEGATVEVFLDSTSIGTGAVNAMGLWNITLGSPLIAGQEVQARQTINGVISALSDPVTVIAPPPPPFVNTPLIAGSIDISGTGTNGATVDVFVDNTNVGTTTVGSGGVWALTVGQTLSAGQTVLATQTVANIISDLSAPVTVQSPTPAPTVNTPIIAGSTSVSGTGAMGATIEVFVDNVSAGMGTVGSTDTWMLALAQSLTASQVVHATQTVAGITSAPSTSVTVVQPPPPPTVGSPLFAGNIQVSGTGLSAASVTLLINGTSAGSTAVTVQGNWALMLGNPLEAGQSVTAFQTVAGLDSLPSAPVIVGAAGLEQIAITPAPTATLEIGQTQQFTATGTFTGGTVEDPLTGVNWTSDDPTVVSINANGLAIAQMAGSAQIHASRDGIDSAVTTLTVMQTGPTLNDFNPKSAAIGESITITGSALTPNTPGALTVTLARQGGGRIQTPVTTSNDTTVIVTVPTGVATGNLEVTIDQLPVLVPPPALFTVVASSHYGLNVEPASANVIQGESASFAIKLSSTTGFTQLAGLSVSGLPTGVTATFTPQQISANQQSLLTVSAPLGQPLGSSPLTVKAAATVDGIPLMEEGLVALTIQSVTTTFMGRTVVSNAVQTPLAGVTINMLGQDGSGNATGCSGQAVSDAAGNFALTNLSAACVGAQLVRFNGATAIFPQGTYAGVDKFYTLTLDQVTKPPVLVHLPRIDNADTVMVQQNAAVDQTFIFPNIPGLALTVYAGTVFTLENGSQPNPFPLTAVEIPLDRLPGSNGPTTPNSVLPFLVGFQPANTSVNKPAAVFFPNTINNPAGKAVPLLTLDPTKGIMVNYGTGTISSDGTQIIPDFDPANPGKRYGLNHLGWHGPLGPLPSEIPKNPPASPGGCKGNPVSLASGLQVLVVTDLFVGGPRGGMAIERNYRTNGTRSGPFGRGGEHRYSHRLSTNVPQQFATFTLIMPDGNLVPFSRQPNGSLINETIPAFQGAVMTTDANNATTLKLKDCSALHFVPGDLNTGSVLVAVTDLNGNQTTLVRDPIRPIRIIEIIDPVGRKLRLDYDEFDRIIKVTDPIGRTVTYTYNNNSQNNLETVTDPEGGVTRYGYSSSGLATITDARGVDIARISYGTNGRVIQELQPDGGVLQFDYTFLNPQAGNSPVLTTEFTDPLGRTTLYRYNTQSFLSQVTDASGQTTVFDREPGTNLLLARQGNATCDVCEDPRQGDVTQTYDANGNLLTVTDALNHTTTFTYDPVVNKIASFTDPLNHQTQRTYDSKGNLLTSTDQNNHMTTFAYNTFGLLVEITDPLNNKTMLDYDADGNLVTVTDPLGNVTTFEYDAISRRVATIDPLGRRTTLTYDGLNRVVSSTDALGQVTALTYDAVGNLLTLTDAKQHTTTFTYDVMNRLATKTDSLGQTESFTYDLAGNLISYSDRRGQTAQFTYDDLNRLVTETYADGSTVQRLYDSRNRLLRVQDSAGGVFSYTYDARGRRTSENGPFGKIAYTYDARGQVVSKQVVGQPPTTYTYNPVGNLVNASLPQAAATMTYDNRNFLTNLTRSNGVTTGYSYDPLGRLLAMVHANGASTIDSLTYTYDAVGNRTNHGTGLGQPLTTQPVVSTFDANNRLLTRDGTTYTYDANGNRLTETDATGTKTYTWDSRNRLARLTKPLGTIDFRYDFAGNLIQQTTTNGNGATTKNLLLDDLTNVAYESRSDGSQFSVLSGQGIDSHLAVSRSNGSTEFGLTDGLNSTVATVDQTGAQTGTMQYEPYGKTTTGSTYPFQYTGRVPVASDLYYYRARFSDPVAGRFISEDPIGFGGNDINLYRYGLNNPVKFTDPTGEFLPLIATPFVIKIVGLAAVNAARVVAAHCLSRPWACQAVVEFAAGYIAGAAHAPPGWSPGNGGIAESLGGICNNVVENWPNNSSNNTSNPYKGFDPNEIPEPLRTMLEQDRLDFQGWLNRYVERLVEGPTLRAAP